SRLALPEACGEWIRSAPAAGVRRELGELSGGGPPSRPVLALEQPDGVAAEDVIPLPGVEVQPFGGSSPGASDHGPRIAWCRGKVRAERHLPRPAEGQDRRKLFVVRLRGGFEEDVGAPGRELGVDIRSYRPEASKRLVEQDGERPTR